MSTRPSRAYDLTWLTRTDAAHRFSVGTGPPDHYSWFIEAGHVS